MQESQFKLQVDRLQETYGARLYPLNRVTMLWRQVQNIPDEDFIQAIDNLISTHRSAPMNHQILDAVTNAQQRQRMERQVTVEDTSTLLQNTPVQPAQCEPDFKDLCMKVLNSRARMTPKEFSDACDDLDRLAEQLGRGKKECHKCGNSGYQLISDEKGARAAYRCRCSIGIKRPPSAIGNDNSKGARLEIAIPFAK